MPRRKTYPPIEPAVSNAELTPEADRMLKQAVNDGRLSQDDVQNVVTLTRAIVRQSGRTDPYAELAAIAEAIEYKTIKTLEEIIIRGQRASALLEYVKDELDRQKTKPE